MRWIIAAGLVGAVVAVWTIRQRRLRQRRGLSRYRREIEDVLHDLDARSKGLRKRAGKVRGQAQRKLRRQANELETRQRELRTKVEEATSEARRVLAGVRR
jgi:hypothetical protein